MAGMSRKTRQIRVGQVAVGGSAPVVIQTMAKAHPSQIDAIVEQLIQARQAGCELARIAVTDEACVQSIVPIQEQSRLPVVADVHFDHRLAVLAAEQGAAGLRINPGTLGSKQALTAVVEAARQASIPIRVGVNAGSLPKSCNRDQNRCDQMVQVALQTVAQIESMGFFEIKVSLKASDVATTIAANRKFARQSCLPIHLGLTEAGPPLQGAVRSAAALTPLLSDDIGDTIRISLSGPPVSEVRAAKYLLGALGKRHESVLISCPGCGRTEMDICSIAERVELRIESLGLKTKVAVMGCEVNGPQEAKDADIGIAFSSRGRGVLFESGQVKERLPNEGLESRLVEMLEQFAKEGI